MHWMKKNHPTIILDFVPGGCTGVAQPCDVRIQQPLKLSMKKTYHGDIVSGTLQQIEAKSKVISIDSRVGTLQDHSMRWIWNAYKAIDNKTLVKKVSASISEQEY